MGHFNMLMVAMVTVTCLELGASFILGGKSFCESPDVCECDRWDRHDCTSRGLTSIPTFPALNHTYNSLDIQFGSNPIHAVGDNAFDKLSCDKVHSIMLSLYHDQLESVSDNAFAPIESCITYLNLDDNSLTSVPRAVMNLTNLQKLLVEHNPIQTFDADVMMSLGQTLKSLYIGIRSLRQWPEEISFLTKLEQLRIFDVDFDELTPTAFDGFKDTLKQLTISGTTLQQLPESLCDLQSLHFIELQFDLKIQNASTFLPFCNVPLSGVDTVRVDHCNLHTVWPNLFQLFPNVKNLQISNNPALQDIDTTHVPYSSSLTTLNLMGNDFDHIPRVIEKFPRVSNLDLSNNKIQTIDQSLLQSVPFLTTLKLANNQLSSIPNDTFNNNTDLHTLSLANNHLTEIPTAVQQIPHLTQLDLTGNPIRCDCSLAWLKNWSSFPAVKILGLCAGATEPVASFLTNISAC